MISNKRGSMGASLRKLSVDHVVRAVFVSCKFMFLAFAVGTAGNWAAHTSMLELNLWAGHIVEPWTQYGYLQEPIAKMAFGFAGALVGVLVVTILRMPWRQVWYALLIFLGIFAFREVVLFSGAMAISLEFWIYSQIPMLVGAACVFLAAVGAHSSTCYIWKRWRDRSNTTSRNMGPPAQ